MIHNVKKSSLFIRKFPEHFAQLIVPTKTLRELVCRLQYKIPVDDFKWYIIKSFFKFLYFYTSTHFTNMCNISSHSVLHNWHLFESVLPFLNSFSYVKSYHVFYYDAEYSSSAHAFVHLSIFLQPWVQSYNFLLYCGFVQN